MLESRNTYDGCMNMEQKDEKPQSNQKPRDQRGPRPRAMDPRGGLLRRRRAYRRDVLPHPRPGPRWLRRRHTARASRHASGERQANRVRRGRFGLDPKVRPTGRPIARACDQVGKLVLSSGFSRLAAVLRQTRFVNVFAIRLPRFIVGRRGSVPCSLSGFRLIVTYECRL